MSMRTCVTVVAALVAALVPAASARLAAQNDLDAFMREVLERRDDNWKKLQQYILDERETIDVRGPAGTTMWGERHEYSWFIRDGYFVRSPVKFNGVTIGEADRRKYEAEYLERQQQRDKRAQERAAARGDAPAPARSADAPPTDVDGLIRQTRQPEFISSAYFLRFRFDEGRYALVGRETVENREALRIEYYPQRLFEDRRGRERDRQQSEKDESYEREMRRLMNKSSRVTLWVDQSAHQILKYTFEDLGWDFLPGQWLVRVDTVRASMTMGEMFEGVWLPRGIDMNVILKLAIGDVDLHYTLDYHDYRRADVTTRIGIPAVK
jgi:hypothetical protein